MAERKFRQALQKIGEAARIRESVAQEMRENIILQKPKAVDPVDYETYITKNKTILHNDPQREMVTFPHDDVVVPPPTYKRKIRTVKSTVPENAEQEASNLLVKECVKFYNSSCQVVKFKYEKYSGGYQHLPRSKPEPLPHHTFEIDAEEEEKDDSDVSSKGVSTSITKSGWLFKGPEGGKENIISFTRQFKRRYFVLKQLTDFTYMLEFYKDEKKVDAKGSIFLELATEAVKNPKKGKYAFEIKMQNRPPYLFAAESDMEANDWIQIINKVINAAETASNVSLERKEEVSTPDKTGDNKPENSMHPELQKYSRETDLGIAKYRQEGRQNLFRVYPYINWSNGDEKSDEEEEEGGEIEVFPKQFTERFMLCLLSFNMKVRINLAEECKGKQGYSNPEPFFLTFSLYDVKGGCKISEDFHLDPNIPEIKSMIPPEVLQAADKLHTVEGKSTSPHLNNLAENWLLDPKRQGIFSVIKCHSEVYLFVRVEKVLQGPVSQATDGYCKTAEAAKTASKIHKQMKMLCSNIGHYRMPFGWAARQLISSNYGPTDLKVFKHDSSKMSEADIIKCLQDLRKPEKVGKLQEIPCDFKISLTKLSVDQALQNTVTSSLVPVKPFPIPPQDPPAVEVDEFVPEHGQLCDTFDSYINNLYVYPLSLRYEHQKSFPKARNIACCVEIRETDDENAIPLKCIYSRPEVGVYTSVASTAVHHHQTSPEYLEEVKIALPLQITEKHHVLFRFYHVSCESSKTSNRSSGSNKKKDHIETAVGFAILPLLQNGRVVVGEQNLPVITHLVNGYMSHDHIGGMRSSASPDLKFVDGGKQILKVKAYLRSTVYTKDQHLHNFFYHCQKMDNMMSPGADSDSVNKLKSLHATDVSTYVQFLPTLLNQLLSLLTKNTSEDVALNAVKVLIHIVHEVHNSDRVDMLKKYVKYVFKPDPVTRGSKQKTIHEELAVQLTSILRPAIADNMLVKKFMFHSWFFFRVLVKSMTLYLVDSDRIKMPRNERFGGDFSYKLETFLNTLAPNIHQKITEHPRETKNANSSMAAFVKTCFTLMDRGFVFGLIASYLNNFGPSDNKSLKDFKFEFLRIVCSHEHYVPLSLPLMRKGMIKTFKDIKLEDLKCDYMLSDDYRKNHYLAGLLLQELKTALCEPRETRRVAIHVVRNQLAKHAFDDRYNTQTQQGRIAALYLPFISIILDHKQHLTEDAYNLPSSHPKVVVNGDVPSNAVELRPHTPQTAHKSVTFDPKQSSVLDKIAVSSVLSPMIDKNQMNGSNTSLTSSASSDKDSGRRQEREHIRPTSSISGITSVSGGPSKSLILKYQRLDIYEIKDLLLCFMHILKFLPEDILLGWFNNSSEYDIIDFFSILEVCLHYFKYQGRKKITDLSIISDHKKASTMPYNRRSTPSLASNSVIQGRSASQYGEVPEIFHAPSSSEGDGIMKALHEANMSTEIGLIVLDILGLYCKTFKRHLENKDGDNSLMKKVFSLYLSFLQTSQSEILQKHVFAAWRSFIKKFATVLFNGNASLCGDLCYVVLKCCNSKLYSTRKEACALLYLLMRANFEYTKKRSFTRVHLQVIISVSKLLGDEEGLSNTRFQESLAMINSYASSDKAMQTKLMFHEHPNGLTAQRRGDGKSRKRGQKHEKSGFPVEVKDLTKRIRTVLMATAQMREHSRDPEMLIDLRNSLAKSYASTPELRKTWLDSMAQIHEKNENYSEAAHCYIHIAALIAEYLKRRGCFPQGVVAFRSISPNIEVEESGIKDDSGMQDVQYTEATMVEFLEKGAKALELAQRYEVLGDIYRLIVPIYEFNREYEQLSESYLNLSKAYEKVVEIIATGKRFLGTYFKVAFYGQYFEEEDGKEYIYKEPKVTNLTEICQRLSALYSDKFGTENVKLIKDSKQVNPAELDAKFAYIQVVYVKPYFDEKELPNRVTNFEKNNNIRRFMFEMPFTKSGKAHGDIAEQCKRRTILTTQRTFPFVTKRIEIVDKKDHLLQPIEVAIDEMQSKVMDLKEVLNQSPTDLIKLQLRLQGCVNAQVNAGPLAYAQAFLDKNKLGEFPLEHVESLKDVFREFILACDEALDLNATKISTEQKEYHEALNAGFHDIKMKLSGILGEKILTGVERRDSMQVFNINSTSTTSTA